MSVEESIKIAIAIFTAIGVFVGPIIAFVIRDIRRKRGEKLKVHFQDLKNEALGSIIPIASTLTGSYGKIDVGRDSTYFTGTELPQPSNSFAAHFPEETTELAEYRRRIREHNRDYEDFCLQIKHDFKSRGIPVVDIQTKLTPCVYDNIFDPLFNYWKELAGNRHPWPDFTQIEEIKTQEGDIFLYAKGWGSSSVARVRKKSDKEKYECVLGEVAGNKEFREEAAKLFMSSDKLVEETRTLKEQLNNKLDDVDKFWPGTKEYKFKQKKKTCPICKKI